MEYGEIEHKVISIANYIDGRIEDMEKTAGIVQGSVFEMIRQQVLKFEIDNGAFVVGQDLRRRLATIQSQIEAILNQRLYTNTVRDFLTDFTKIQDKSINLFLTVNDLELEISQLHPAKQIIYDQAKNALTDAVANEYIEPVKKLIAQNVIQGRSIMDTVKLLEKWDEGELSSGRLATGSPTPNLKQYATQIARDTAYSVQRTTNNIFKERFNLLEFIYAGGLVKDSRPLCRHLVKENRPIKLEEMPPLIAAYPQGLYPGTTKENFISVCGGFNCSHIAHAI